MIRCDSTAYGPPWEGIQGTGVTATGIDLRNSPHLYIVAVDPNVIPLHSKLAIHPNPFGSPAVFKAEDTGSAIKGNRIDFYDWRGRRSQLAWGHKLVEVTILGKGEVYGPPAPANPGPGVLPSKPALIGDPHNAGGTVTDYSYVLRYTAQNLNRISHYLVTAGKVIRRWGNS